ncbi:MAG: hypothetical protein IJ668_06840 [Selenomonadaceae bacterium]|nr:hypothetical protein [Selenomonadaceae bacterium]
METTMTLTEGTSVEVDGITYTAEDGDAQLNLDSDGKVAGLASGKVSAVVSGASDSPTITFDAGDGALEFTASSDGEVITLNRTYFTFELINGEFNYTGSGLSAGANSDLAIVGTLNGYSYRNENHTETYANYTITTSGVTVDTDHQSATHIVTVDGVERRFSIDTRGTVVNDFYEQGFALTEGSSMIFNAGDYAITVTALADAGGNISINENGLNFIPDKDDGALQIVLSRANTDIIGGTLQCNSGSVNFGYDQSIGFGKDADGNNASFDFTLADSDYTFSIAATDEAKLGIAVTEDGFTFTPGKDDGALEITLKQSDTTLFSNTISVDGSITLNSSTRALGLTDGTVVTVSFETYTVTATAEDNVEGVITVTQNGIGIAPSGKLRVELANDSGGSMTADLEVLSGSFTLGADGNLLVSEGTELDIKFSDTYSVALQVTGDAGGSIRISDDGISFAPNSDDGGLELSVTRDGVTRTASLDMTGSLTYKLDGSITLAKDTVLRNVLEDGNILTITALTDASGSIIFHPSIGLQITPATSDALNIALLTDDLEVVNISSFTGSINYNGGVITASNGSQARLSVYNTWETDLQVSGGTASIQFTADRTVYTANEGATFVLDYLDGSTLEMQGGSFSDIYATDTADAIELVSAGSNFRCNDEEFVFTLETAGSYTLNGMNVTTTADNVQVQLVNYDTVIVDGISYTPLDENVSLTIGVDGTTCSGGKVSMQMDGFNETFGYDLTDGSIAYNSSTGKFTVAEGAKTYIKNGDFPDQFVAKGDVDITVSKNDDGTFGFSLEDSASFAIERNGVTVLQTTATLEGSIIANPTTNQITVPKDTTLTMSPGDNRLQIRAVDDAGGELTLVESGIRFAPNEGDGALEFNFVSAGRKSALEVTGAFVYGGLGRLSVEDGTEAKFTWEDGNVLTLSSSGSTGSVAVDPDRGIKITSDDDNLSLKFESAAGYTTEVSSIKGSLYYREGAVTIEENTRLTATGSIGGQAVDVTLEAIDGDGYLIFGTTGVTYGADAGKLQITYTLGELESVFTVNTGSVLIGHNVFTIAEGTDLATDLQDFIPALYFTTGAAGSYTINGQTITTRAENLAMTATDNQMVFTTSDDAVEYEGMTFAGNGNVTLKPDVVVLGNNVAATGFNEGNSFMLAEEGDVTVDAKIFTLEPLYLERDGEQILIPMNVSVEGAVDGFTFSRTLTEESEEYVESDPPLVGSIFTEKFISHGDDSYRTVTDSIGLEKVIGISNGATIEGGAELDDEVTLSYYELVADTTGTITIGKREYVIAEGTATGVGLRAHFDSYDAFVDKVNDLNGTVSGDFSAGPFTVNGGSKLEIFGDIDISIAADENGYEIFGLDANDSLKVTEAGTYTVNGEAFELQADGVIVGTAGGSAKLLDALVSPDVEELMESLTGVDDYGTTITDPTEVKALLESGELNGDMALRLPNKTSADFSAFNGKKAVAMSRGAQTVEFNDEDGNAAIVDGDATGSKQIIFGDGKDVGLFSDAYVLASLSGADSIIADGDGYTALDMTKADDARIIARGGTLKMVNYEPSRGAIQTDFDDVTEQVKDNGLKLGIGNVQLEDGATVWFDSQFINIANQSGDTLAVGFASGGTLDTGALDGNCLLEGNYDGENARGSTLKAGNGDDTILAGARDLIDGGAGTNEIYLTPYDERNANVGARIDLNGGGENVVHNFRTGFDSDSDKIYSDVDLSIRAGFDGDDITFDVSDSTKVTLAGVADDADFAEIIYARGDSSTKVALAKQNATIRSADAQVYIGRAADDSGFGSGVDFSGTTDDLIINLSDKPVENGSGDKLFYGINSAAAGDGLTTLNGSSNDETLVAGNGFTSINGGGGNDLLVGKASSTDKVGHTTFFFLAGDGNDTVSDFDFVTAANRSADTADKIDITDANIVTEVGVRGDDVVLKINDGDDQLTLEEAAGKAFKINDLIAKVDENISYDGLANCYVADGGSSLTVDSTLDSAEIWLDGSQGTYFLGDVRTLDASAVNGNTSLVGNAFDNTIRAGHGDASLWGGASASDDLLIGGDGSNTFFYALGNGSDTIQGINDGDLAVLVGISLDHISSADINDNSVSIELKDGGRLLIEGSADITCQLGDGSRYSVDRENRALVSR